MMAFISTTIASMHSAASGSFKDSLIGTLARYENSDSSASLVTANSVSSALPIT